MTIFNRTMNDRLRNLERCAEYAPEGTYEQVKKAVNAIHEAADDMRLTFNQAGLLAMADDRLRNFEVAMYEYMLACNPDANELLTGEGFGKAMTGPSRFRVMAQAASDRDFLRQHRAGSSAP